MVKEPRYWGTWKGRVAWAITIDGARYWEEIRDLTGLSSKTLKKVLSELFDAQALEKRDDGSYWLNYELYKEYQAFAESQEPEEEPVFKERDKGAVKFSKSEQDDLVTWIDDWKKLKKLDFSLKPKHFFVTGRHLDDLSKEIITKARKEVLAVNPFVEKCDLSDTLRDIAKKGTNVLLITQPPEIDENSQYQKLQKERAEYHTTLRDAGVKVIGNKTAHAKLIAVDRRVAIVSSMNFNPRSSGGKSWEAGLVTVDETVVEGVIDAILELKEKPESKEN